MYVAFSLLMALMSTRAGRSQADVNYVLLDAPEKAQSPPVSSPPQCGYLARGMPLPWLDIVCHVDISRACTSKLGLVKETQSVHPDISRACTAELGSGPGKGLLRIQPLTLACSCRTLAQAASAASGPSWPHMRTQARPRMHQPPAPQICRAIPMMSTCTTSIILQPAGCSLTVHRQAVRAGRLLR